MILRAVQRLRTHCGMMHRLEMLERMVHRAGGACVVVGRMAAWGMRIHVFVSGLVILALGVMAHRMLGKAEALGFLQGALTLGGGLVICGLFSLKMKWHGLIGAGVLALLGTTRGLGNVPDMVKLLGGERSRGAAPMLELGVTLICLLLLLRVLGALMRERTRRMLEKD